MRTLFIAIIAALAAAGVGLLPANAAPASPGKTVQILGMESFQPDEFFSITYRFTPRHLSVRSGQLTTWNNQTTDAHTVSIVSPADVPKTVDQVNNCGICTQLQAAHFPNGAPPAGQPVLVLEDFKPASPPAHFDAAGDSVVVPPPGLGLPLSVTAIVSAPAGTELRYICAFHPWMQGTIRVLSPSDPDTD
jgi:plastocyanin